MDEAACPGERGGDGYAEETSVEVETAVFARRIEDVGTSLY
jgi:hypothetical protein